MCRMTDRGGKYLGGISIITVHLYNLRNQCNAILTDIIETPHKRRNIRCTCLGCKQCLTDRKYQSTICTDTFAREVFNGLDTFCNARHLHYDMRIQGCQFFTLFNHAFIVGGYHLGTYIALHNITDVHIVLTLVLHSFDPFFCHKRRISGNSVEYAQVIGLPNLFQICRINKKLHDINV